MNLFDPLIPYTAFLYPDPLYPPTITDPLPLTLFLYQGTTDTFPPRNFPQTPINKGPNEIQALLAIEANLADPIPTNHSTDINPPIESESLSLKIGPIGNRYLRSHQPPTSGQLGLTVERTHQQSHLQPTLLPTDLTDDSPYPKMEFFKIGILVLLEIWNLEFFKIGI